MIEFTTLVTLCILYLIFFRSGKTPPLENPLVIERPGQYHMTLAPLLNLAQPFIEDLVSRIGPSSEASANCETKFFEVHDKQVNSHGFTFYLLAITQRNGVLYFQAARPLSKDQIGQLHTIKEFADNVLSHFPSDNEHVSCEEIVTAVKQVAGQRGIQAKIL